VNQPNILTTIVDNVEVLMIILTKHVVSMKVQPIDLKQQLDIS